jgi:cytoskeleton protein RodZ
VTIGERLREARMRRGIDIGDVEVATKIRAKYLRALENEEFGMLPGGTFAKTFLRTYAEYLGLDAQLLVEEYRAEHEPRGETDLPLAPRAEGVRDRRGGGPPIGPGTAFAIGIVLLLVLFAIIGLTGGDEDGGGEQATTTDTTREEEREAPARERRRERRSTPRVLSVRVVPTGPTYVCVDDGRGTVRFEGNITGPRTFRSRSRLRINLGRAAVRLTVNGKRVPIEDGPSGAGFSFSRSGRATPLAQAERPCV